MLCLSLFCFQFISRSYQSICCKVGTELQLFAFTFTYMYPFHTTRHIRLIHTTQSEVSKAVELIAGLCSAPQLFHLSLSLLSVSLSAITLPFLLSLPCSCKLNCCDSLPPNDIMFCLPTWASVGKVLDSQVVLRGFFYCYIIRWLDCFSGSVPPKFEHKLHRH